MIVDLLRNDLGKICSPGSVHVAEHKRIESYQNVHHLISIVRGNLRDDVSYGEIFKATFPGGSITGCPKIRAMEIIDELEPNCRHVYTGSMGYLGFHGNMDVNIAIRTMIAIKRIEIDRECYQGFLSVGGGVVYDSDPELEYEETLHKGKTFFEVLRNICS
jgi:para-aminobenzoate synthetase component 1